MDAANLEAFLLVNDFKGLHFPRAAFLGCAGRREATDDRGS